MLYEILESTDSDDLANKVFKYIRNGWEIQGGVSVVYVNSYTLYAQAMIKRV